jgi:hypothetical protein
VISIRIQIDPSTVYISSLKNKTIFRHVVLGILAKRGCGNITSQEQKIQAKQKDNLPSHGGLGHAHGSKRKRRRQQANKNMAMQNFFKKGIKGQRAKGKESKMSK